MREWLDPLVLDIESCDHWWSWKYSLDCHHASDTDMIHILPVLDVHHSDMLMATFLDTQLLWILVVFAMESHLNKVAQSIIQNKILKESAIFHKQKNVNSSSHYLQWDVRTHHHTMDGLAFQNNVHIPDEWDTDNFPLVLAY